MNNELIKINQLLANLTKSHQYTKTLQLFHQIQSSPHLKPDQYTLSTTLTAAAHLRHITAGNQLHAQIIRSGFKSFPHVSNTLLFLYAKSHNLPSVKLIFNEIEHPDVYSWTTLLSACTKLGEIDYACHLLDEMPQRNEAVWNAVITGCADNGCKNLAIGVFKRMHSSGVRVDNYSLASVLSLCGLELIEFGMEVHSLVVKTGFSARSSVTNALITMYFNFGDANQAYKVFEETEWGSVRDQITYNAMIAGLVSLGRDEFAFEMFKSMLEVGLDPTERTFVSVMSSCGSKRAAGQVHTYAVKTGFQDFSSVSNAAISMYSSCGDLKAARMVFNTLNEKDSISWNAIITSYAQENLCKDAMLAYLQMQEQGIKPDEFTIGSLLSTLDSLVHVDAILAVVIKNSLILKTEVANAMISTLTKHNTVREAYCLFREMSFKNLISWNSMISGFHSTGWSGHALCLFSEMLESGITPDVYTLTIVLNICATIPDISHGKEVHGYILKHNCFHEPSLGNALIALYAKCGVLDQSVKVFSSMVNKDIVSWNSMISAYAQHGKGEEAVSCFGSMTVKPDDATFTAALTACSHAGLVDTGVEIFNSMVNEYGVEPGVDHLSCLVDLVGRAGYLDAAEKLIRSDGLKVHSSVWWNLFSACAAHGDLRLGRIVAGLLLEEGDDDKGGVYVVLGNILANGGHWEEAEGVRKMMRSCRVVKQPGYSWIRS